MKRFLPILLLLTCMMLPTLASSQTDQTIQTDQTGSPSAIAVNILDFGIYEVNLSGDAKGQELTEQTMDQITELSLISETTSIPLQRGTHFGYRYQVTGLTEGQSVRLVFELHHPLMVSDRGNVLDANSFGQTVHAGGIFHDIFVFENDWEMEPGEYVFKIFHENELVSSIRFEAHP